MLRYIILAAVSTDEQIDKASIPSQLELARAAGERLGGVCVGEYVIDGYSRTSYFNLSDAINDIPPLKQCLDDMQKWDLLIVKNFDRLGSLGMPIFYYLSMYNKQLHSVEQATAVYPPETYRAGRDTAVPMMLQTAGISQVYRIAKISDAFRVGISARARRGVYANAVPYGYIKVDRNTVKIDPQIAALFAQFPGWLMAGVTISEIVGRADDSGVPASEGGKWSYHQIKYILRNPFYAGKTFWGRGKKHPELGYWMPDNEAELFDGTHEAIWTWEQFQAMQAEIIRRRRSYHRKYDYNFTALLFCSVCEGKLYIGYNKKLPHRYWRCKNHHVSMRAEKMNTLVAAELKRMILEADNAPALPEPDKLQDYSRRELSAVRRNIANLDARMDAYEPADFIDRRKKFLTREAELLDEQKLKQESKRREGERTQAVRTLHEIAQDLGEWITDAEPSLVKYHLSRVARFVVAPGGTVRGVWV